MKKNIPFFLFLLIVCWCPLCLAQTPESKTDYLGYYKTSHSYQRVIEAGATVINYPEDHSFAVLWVPPEVTQGRIMVLLHGSQGTPYEEIKDELAMAQKYKYLLVGIQWHDRQTDRYYPASQVYRIIDKTLQYVKKKYSNDLSRVAFSGFSRGAAVSYELAYFDLTHRKFFDLFIAHSGGIATDLVVAPGENPHPDDFLKNFVSGRLGKAPFVGGRFFLYSGDEDESWGIKMSLYVENAKQKITQAGGEVVECVREAHGKHMGYRLNTAVHERSIRHFIRLTP
ncbi:MAG: hypothetical protein ACD_62C00658G0001 [uncultured bacterium]|nr:MAG: hypothetical protein ACD_62C00658G0001 [uncultured bacterium]